MKQLQPMKSLAHGTAALAAVQQAKDPALFHTTKTPAFKKRWGLF
ncbi:hypothetical protein [Pseudocnuella soli]|nr:hypothetical protein [Pseudocnuella soli]